MTALRELLCNNRIMMAAIVLNTIIMFVGGFFRDTTFFEWCDTAFTLIFVCEATAKISKHGWPAYWQRNWNRFDFIVLIIALPSILSPLFEHEIGTSAVLALRSMRLLKSLKVLHFIPNVHKLLKGLKIAVRASSLVFAALVIVLFVFSILSFALFGRISPDYFGNPAISLYSIFRLFSIEGWYEIPEAIAAGSSAAMGVFARCYFSALTFLGGIIGMSLVNSVFVDAMTEDNNDEVLEKLEQIEARLKDMDCHRQ